jgi:hypothetical protein
MFKFCLDPFILVSDHPRQQAFTKVGIRPYLDIFSDLT